MQFHQDTKLTHRTFRIYHHTNKATVMVVFSFYKPYEKVYKSNTWILPVGMPTPAHSVRYGFFYRMNLHPPHFRLAEQGKFTYRYRFMDSKYQLATFITLYGKSQRRYLVQDRNATDKIRVKLLCHSAD